MAPSYTWISSVCANATAGTTNRATAIAASARISIRRKTFIWLRLFYKIYLTPECKPLECRTGESEGGRADERASTIIKVFRLPTTHNRPEGGRNTNTHG